jgi:hypothetical protein
MREAAFRETVSTYHELVESIERFSYQEEEQLEQLRAQLRLFDGTILWVREIYVADHLDAYSYYWLRSDESIIIGWDNAPHHRDIETFPHHRHREGRIEVS